MAVTQVKLGDTTYMAMPVIKYEIEGKTPKEVWAILDGRVSETLRRL